MNNFLEHVPVLLDEILENLNLDKLPKYIIENKNKYEKWLN